MNFITIFKEDSKAKRAMKRGLVAASLLALGLSMTGCGSKDKDSVSANTATEVNVVGKDIIVTPPDGLEQTSNQELISLIGTYYDALRDGDVATVESVKKDTTEEEKIRLTTKAADIESYSNLLVYDMPGASEGAYIVLIYSETKYVGIETKAPGLQATYVTTAEDGKLYIDSNVDQATMDYVEAKVSEDVYKNYFELVKASYTDAITADSALYDYMANLNAKLEAAIAEANAAAEAAAAEAQPAEEAAATPVNETVTVKEKVNVRASDSQEADKLGQVDGGTTLTRYEVLENGWSKIDFNGQEGYVKSEFLESNGDSQAVESTDQAEAPAETTEPAATSGKVTVKESVRIRKSASTDSEVVKTAFQGETYDLIQEQADGWCKISVDGNTCYIKSEFVDITR